VNVSELFKFYARGQGKSHSMLLEIDSTQLHGRVAEIVGRTATGSGSDINGQSVPNVSPDGLSGTSPRPSNLGNTRFPFSVRIAGEGRT